MAAGPVLVVDFGAQYAQLIARRVREANVYSELVPHSMPVDEMLAKDPQAIILSGGPASVFEPGAPRVDKKLFDAGVPVLGICYGFQAMAYALGADVDKAALGEYGKTETTIDKAEGLLDGSPAEQSTWMSHGVAVKTAPEGFEVLAHTEGAPVAAMQDESRKLYGVQWHPEVKHTPMGQKLIENFLHKCAGLGDNWNASNIIEDQVKKIREKVGDAQVICGLSGGVDSAVAAALVHKAIGEQLTCVFVDHGLLRKGEAEQVKHDFVEATGIKLIAVDASEDFLTALKGDHRGEVHSHVRKGSASGHRRGGRFRQGSQVPCSGHAVSGRRRVRRRRWRGQHQIAPQCGRPAEGHQIPAHRAAHPVQG